MRYFGLSHLFLALPLAYFSLHFTWEVAPQRFVLHEVAYHSASQSVVASTPSLPSPFIVTFHQPAEDLLSMVVKKYTADGVLQQTFTLPPNSLKTPFGENIPWVRKPGFLTHPDDGSYFIWFPRLGSKVYFFDSKGAFLWEKQESRYLQASPSGKYILAASGDHSRLMLLNPSLQPLADFEGLIFTHFKLDDSEENDWQFCASFLHGDVVAAAIKKKEQYRISLPGPVKALECDFAANVFWAQVEENKDGNYYDLLLQADLGQTNPQNFTVLYQAERSWPLSWPLAAASKEEIAFILASEDNRQAEKIVVLHENKVYTINFPLTPSEIAHTRLYATRHGFVVTTQQAMITLDRYGITGWYHRENLQNFRKVKNRFYLIDANSLSVFQVPHEP